MKAREGIVIAIGLPEGDQAVPQKSVMADHVIEIPASSELLLPILEVVPLQLLAVSHRRAPQAATSISRAILPRA